METRLNFTKEQDKIKLHQENTFDIKEFKELYDGFKAQLEFHNQSIKQQEEMIKNTRETITKHFTNKGLIEQKIKDAKEFAKQNNIKLK